VHLWRTWLQGKVVSSPSVEGGWLSLVFLGCRPIGQRARGESQEVVGRVRPPLQELSRAISGKASVCSSSSPWV
jgi:hypothetical protein